MRIFFKKNAVPTGFALRQNLWRILSGFFLFVIFFIFPLDTHAARLFSSGCELQGDVGGNATNDLEWGIDGTSADSTRIITQTKRSGLSSCAAVRATNGTAAFYHQFAAAESASPYYFRFNVYIETMPAESTDIAAFDNDIIFAGFGDQSIVLNADGTLALYGDEGTLLDSSASPLALRTWYRVEWFFDGGGAAEVRLDGTQILFDGAHDGDGGSYIELGLCMIAICTGGTTIGTIYFDDIALNDTTGLSQNSWPGKGSIVHMQPDGAGDANGCTAGTFADVDEITPDDTTTKCTLTTDGGGDILDTNVESSSNAGIDTYATVSLVQVGAREAAVSAAAESWNLRIKSASGGTVTNGSTATHNDVTYRTNGDVVPRNYTLTSYTDPATGVAWTPTGTNSLNNMQIGANSIDASPDINLSTLWALVEYVTHQSRSTWNKTRFKLNGGRYLQR